MHICAQKLVSRTSKQVSRNLGPLWQPGVYNDTTQNDCRQTFPEDNSLQLQIQNCASRRINYHYRDRSVGAFSENILLLGSVFGRTDYSRIFIFGPPDFSADFLAGFFSPHFCGKKVPRKILQENLRQNPPKFIQEILESTHFCRGAGPIITDADSSLNSN